MTSTTASATSQDRRGIIARVWRDYLSRRWTWVAVAAFCAVLAAALNGVLVGALQPAVDRLIVAHGRNWDWVILPRDPGGAERRPRCGALIGQSMLINRIGNGVVGDIQRQLLGNFVRGDLARLRATHSGGFVSKILFDANLVREAAAAGVLNYLQNGLTLAAMVAVMFWMDWPLTVVALIVAPFVGWVLRDYAKRTTKAAHGAMEESSTLTSAIMESLDGVRVVKMENKEAFEEQRVADAIARRQKHIIAGGDARAMAAPVSEMMVMVMICVVIAYAAWRIQLDATHIGPVPDQADHRRLVHLLPRRADDGQPVAAAAGQPADGDGGGPDRGAAPVRDAGRRAADQRRARRRRAAGRPGDRAAGERHLRLRRRDRRCWTS